MKESAWDKQLWQHKMQQLPLEGDEHAMWQNMQSLLDENMPGGSSGEGSAAPKNFPGTGTILSAIIIVAAVAVLLYHFINTTNSNKQKAENTAEKLQADSPKNLAN